MDIYTEFFKFGVIMFFIIWFVINNIRFYSKYKEYLEKNNFHNISPIKYYLGFEHIVKIIPMICNISYKKDIQLKDSIEKLLIFPFKVLIKTVIIIASFQFKKKVL